MEEEKNFFDILNEARKIDLKDFQYAISSLEEMATLLNKTFGQTRERLGEIMSTVSNAIPRITRLGGNITNVFETLNQISDETARNVLTNEKNVERLYAASKVLDTSVGNLVNYFGEVGVSFAQIPNELEKSVNYINSIGGNTQVIMKNVTYNLDQLNRFQFEGGVVGLTKMAAQSTMLKFNMRETFSMAEKVISPEGAVEVAAAFQRMGVTAGNLVDPFQLMNQSINDPQGLQDSLINVAKSFARFDEETKTFKINPQGVLIFKELGPQIGVSANELSKAAVAASEFDRRLSKINSTGFNIKEDDKKYLANILDMTAEGEYTVNIRSKFGEMVTKNLEDLTETEFKKLIEEQKKGGKTLEDIARSQLSVDEQLLSSVLAIKDAIIFGTVGATTLTDFVSGVSRSIENGFGVVSDEFASSKAVSKQIDDFVTNTLDTLKKTYKRELTAQETFDGITKSINTQFGKISDGLSSSLDNAISKYIEKNKNITGIEKELTKIISSFSETFKSLKTTSQLPEFTMKNFISGETNLKTTPIGTTLPNLKQLNTNITGQVDLKGNVNVNITLPPDFTKLSETQQKQMFDKIFNSEELRNKISSVVNESMMKKPGTQ